MGQLHPMGALSENEFVFTDIPQLVTLKFTNQETGKSPSLEIKQEGEPKLILLPFSPITPTDDELEEYTGTYTSDELEATFKIERIKNTLRFTHKNAPQGILQSNFKDIFRLGNMGFIFSRDDNKTVSSFVVYAGRVTNLRFIKQ